MMSNLFSLYVIPGLTGIQSWNFWIPVFTEMTRKRPLQKVKLSPVLKFEFWICFACLRECFGESDFDIRILD